jgi:hypothetical protein
MVSFGVVGLYKGEVSCGDNNNNNKVKKRYFF